MVTRIGQAFSRFRNACFMAVKASMHPVAFGAIAMLVDRDGKVLLARHSYRRGWSLPGGGVGRGEPALHAVIREMNEELGTVRSKPPVFVSLFTNKTGWATNVIASYRFAGA